ncbi:MAG: RNA polymerase sigma factor [Sphingobacteriales bacterium]|nr:MAG: RNA polymerase sigma factor [Sphingobacteriales bacterium]
MTIGDFDLMITRHSTVLHPYAVSLTNDQEDAKDLYQETMLRALLYRENYQFGTNLKAWLYTIMRNIFINNYRRRQKFAEIEKEPMLQIATGTSRPGANDGWQGLRMREIKAAMHRLPDGLRLAFELYYTGYKYQEISQLLEEPLGTVKSRIHMARKQLTSQIER